MTNLMDTDRLRSAITAKIEELLDSPLRRGQDYATGTTFADLVAGTTETVVAWDKVAYIMATSQVGEPNAAWGNVHRVARAMAGVAVTLLPGFTYVATTPDYEAVMGELTERAAAILQAGTGITAKDVLPMVTELVLSLVETRHAVAARRYITDLGRTYSIAEESERKGKKKRKTKRVHPKRTIKRSYSR